jgi:hypothetical protein
MEKKEIKNERKKYVKPSIEVVKVDNDSPLLASSTGQPTAKVWTFLPEGKMNASNADDRLWE